VKWPTLVPMPSNIASYLESGLNGDRRADALVKLGCLEALGAITYEGEGVMPTRITVRDLPQEVPKAYATAEVVGEKYKPAENKVEAFFRHWSDLHLRFTKLPFDVVHRRDDGVVRGLLKQFSLEDLKGVVTFFWNHRDHDEGTSIGYFKLQFEEIIAGKNEYERDLDTGPLEPVGRD